MLCRSSFPSGSTSRRHSAQAGQGRGRRTRSSRSGAPSADRSCHVVGVGAARLSPPPSTAPHLVAGDAAEGAGSPVQWPLKVTGWAGPCARRASPSSSGCVSTVSPSGSTPPTRHPPLAQLAAALTVTATRGTAPRHSRARPVVPTGGSQQAMSGWGGYQLGIGPGFCEAQACPHQPPWPPATRTSALATAVPVVVPLGMRGLFVLAAGRDHGGATLRASPSTLVRAHP